MKAIVYTVHAYRWGDRENHSYTVGVFSKKHAAMKAADEEKDYRGGKYECEVLEMEIDKGIQRQNRTHKIIVPLPSTSTLGKLGASHD